MSDLQVELLYRFKSVTPDGRTHRGCVGAADRDGAARHLQAEGHVLLELIEPAPDKTWLRFLSLEFGRRGRIPTEAIAQLIDRLALLLNAGITVEAALSILGASQPAGITKRSIDDVVARLRAGSRFSDALAADHHAFPAEVVAMVRAGEAGGALAQTLQRLGHHLVATDIVRRSTRAALIYPAVLLATAIGSVVMILTVVIPELEPVITQSGLEPPFPARLAFLASALLRQYGWVASLLTVAAGWVIHRTMTDPNLKARRDTLLLRVPVLGRALRCNDTGRFARTLGGLLEGGVPLAGALVLACPSILNQALSTAIVRVAAEVREGQRLSGPLAAARIFPDLASQMIRIGEETGRLGPMLVQLAEICERDTKRTLDSALTLLVPLLTILIGIMVGGIITAIMTTVLSMNELVR